MAVIDLKLESWKNKLLDLGKRNRLLNYRDTKRSNLRIKVPEIFDLWQSFVVEEEPLEFDYYDDEQTNMFETTDDYEDDLSNITYNVVTNQTIKEQQKTLRILREKAKTAIEEQGVNILYLSFGFLKWYESGNSENYFTSPIVLVPVSLTIESITSPYILNLHEDEIVLNPTLLYKLENDFGIKLPEFDEDDDLNQYLDKIKQLIEKNKWEVIHDVGLSLLSFLKINMYKDLDIHKDKIIKNAVVRALSGDNTALTRLSEDIDNFDHDKQTKPTDIYQVVDADSSQQDAVLCAKKGVSFVLQGPPGTGKSQTITNIIAECLADGKKVLFVSEKMAALDVVKNRLTNAGLDSFCLTLHSNKANKKEVLEQLGIVLNLTKKKASISDDAYQKLDLLQSHKGNLNDYADAIFTRMQPLNKTIYEVNGYLAGLLSYPDVIFSLENILEVTQEKFNLYINLLTHFSDTAGKMSDDYKLNPWYGTNVPHVSNELRHDIGALIGRLIPKVTHTIALCKSIDNDLKINIIFSYNIIINIIEILNHASKSPKVPPSWILGDDIAPLFTEIDELSNCSQQFTNVKLEIEELYNQAQKSDNSILSFDSNKLFELNGIEEELELFATIIKNNYCYLTWENISDFNKIECCFKDLEMDVVEYNSIKSGLLEVFEKEIFDIDYKSIYSRFKTDYTSILKIFNRQYKADKKAVQGLYRHIVKKVSDEQVIETLTKLRSAEDIKLRLSANGCHYKLYFGDLFDFENTNLDVIRDHLVAYQKITEIIANLKGITLIVSSIKNRETTLRIHYDFLYNGLKTDWNNILLFLNWAKEFRKLCERDSVSHDFVRNICKNAEKISLCNTYIEQLSRILEDINVEFNWYLSLFDNKEDIKNLSLSALIDKLEKCKNGLALLEEWIDFRTARSNCQTEGLSDYIEKIEDEQVDVKLIIPIFKKRFFRLWLDSALPSFPSVINFRRRTHEATISEFSELDKLQFGIAQARIRKKLIDGLPTLDRFTTGVDEISILKRELGKQRKIMPIRKLFKEIPNLLLTLKPCLMMSPLSVSLFLEADSYLFDIIIFDEASQVCTENAIGAISRGKQVVIAGDSKQLPPTNFFNASTSDSDYDTDDDDDSDAYESILDEAGMLPERTLLWHYRSRHEHLIAFSNAKIYKNNLITFPSNVEKAKDNGVEYIYVNDGFYDRGGKKGNVIEAKKIAELVFEHFNKFPNRSLGIIAFGEVQQQAIETAIRQLRKEKPQFENFFNEDNREPFFVKNLENVQGDERDTIIFSIGYAKDQSGKMYMNFGPLSKSGGERRLNVAITRAKLNIKLVGSIIPTDIEIERISAEGPKLLRSYIDFAINGADALSKEATVSDTVEHDSPFERSVYNFLERKGYKLVTQVGCSGYRIDMAVKHPTISGRFVLGIECDGAAYHSARTARERDRLRQAVLEDMGWKIYRIWSTDWIKDPVSEGQKLLDVVERAIAEYYDPDIDNFKNDIIEERADFLHLDNKEICIEQQLNPYNFAEQKETDFSDLPRDAYGYLSIKDCIQAIVNNEYPIHYELLCKKLAPLYGNEKATVKVRREVDYGLQSLSGIIRKDDFLYPKIYTQITPKALNNNRNINHISPEEIAEAMCVIIDYCIGITKEALYAETARAYGFNRTGANIIASMQKTCELLLSNGRIKEVDGKIVVDKTKEVSSESTCSNCGNIIKKDDLFCGNCGQKLN